jgi:hypothetical protein
VTTDDGKRAPSSIECITEQLTQMKGDERASLWALITRSKWRDDFTELLPLLESQLLEADPEDKILRQQLLTAAFYLCRDDAPALQFLTRVLAKSNSVYLRFALLHDVLLIPEKPDEPFLRSTFTARQCAALLARTFPAPENELALAVTESYGSINVLRLAGELSFEARELMNKLTALPGPCVATGMVAFLAAAARIFPAPRRKRE